VPAAVSRPTIHQGFACYSSIADRWRNQRIRTSVIRKAALRVVDFHRKGEAVPEHVLAIIETAATERASGRKAGPRLRLAWAPIGPVLTAARLSRGTRPDSAGPRRPRRLTARHLERTGEHQQARPIRIPRRPYQRLASSFFIDCQKSIKLAMFSRSPSAAPSTPSQHLFACAPDCII
jgi:hypothetical protein